MASQISELDDNKSKGILVSFTSSGEVDAGVREVELGC